MNKALILVAMLLYTAMEINARNGCPDGFKPDENKCPLYYEEPYDEYVEEKKIVEMPNEAVCTRLGGEYLKWVGTITATKGTNMVSVLCRMVVKKNVGVTEGVWKVGCDIGNGGAYVLPYCKREIPE